MTDRIVVAVNGPQGRIEVALAPQRTVAELLPIVLRAFGSDWGFTEDVSGWDMGRPGEDALPRFRTLVECGVQDGDLLQLRAQAWAPLDGALQSLEGDGQADPDDPLKDEVASRPRPTPLPDLEVETVLPQPSGLRDRLRAVGNAMRMMPTRPATKSVLPSPQAISRPGLSSPFERAREAWFTSGYLRRLELAIATPKLRRPITIAVVSPKGGVGKTTTAILLGTLLAMIRRDRIVAIDSDPDYGTLGRSLVPEHPVFIDDFIDVLEHPALTVALLDHSLGRAAHGLMVLPAPTEAARMARIDGECYRRVIRRLQELVGVIILDCGAGMHGPATQAALDASDQVVLISDAEPATASLVADVVFRLEEAGRSYLLVVNKVPWRGGRLDLGKLTDHLPNRNRLRVIPHRLEAAAKVVEGAFTWPEAPTAWHRAVLELAVALVAEWEDLVPPDQVAEGGRSGEEVATIQVPEESPRADTDRTVDKWEAGTDSVVPDEQAADRPADA